MRHRHFTPEATSEGPRILCTKVSSRPERDHPWSERAVELHQHRAHCLANKRPRFAARGGADTVSDQLYAKTGAACRGRLGCEGAVPWQLRGVERAVNRRHRLRPPPRGRGVFVSLACACWELVHRSRRVPTARARRASPTHSRTRRTCLHV
eukprot:SAG31_NODE_11491_length_1024_cov_1.686486_1_plen_152_part_00